jgi:predicted MPP superfamily phosphohydrolase
MHPALVTAIILFSLLGHGYFWVAIVNRLHAWAGPRVIIDALTLGSCVGFLFFPFIAGWQWGQAGDAFFDTQSLSALARVSQVYLLACGFFGLGKFVARYVGDGRKDDLQVVLKKSQCPALPTRAFPPDILRSRYAMLLGVVPGNQALNLKIDHKQLFIPRLPKELASLRVVHISDFHITGAVGPEWYQHVVEHVNTLEPDVVLVTGDLVEVEQHRDWLLESMRPLRAKYGIYYVLGNHDYYIDAERTVRELAELGWIHVGGTATTANWNNYPVLIAGNEVPWLKKLANLSEFVESSGQPPFRVMLMHTPDQFDWACVNHGDLAVAGHNHGGQICFPILGAVAAPSLYGTRFAGGVFRRGNTVMHVTRGIGGETPMRWNCPPEIAVLELVGRRD